MYTHSITGSKGHITIELPTNASWEERHEAMIAGLDQGVTEGKFTRAEADRAIRRDREDHESYLAEVEQRGEHVPVECPERVEFSGASFACAQLAWRWTKEPDSLERHGLHYASVTATGADGEQVTVGLSWTTEPTPS